MARKDAVTLELPGIARPRGRPVTGKAKTPAQRQAAYRARQGKSLSVLLPADVAAEFDAFLQFKNLDKSAVIAKLIRSQLLRKR